MSNFEIHRGRKGAGPLRRHRQEIVRLSPARSAEDEVVIGADPDAGPLGFPPVTCKSDVTVRDAFRRLDIREGDIIASHGGPVDGPLVVGNVDPPQRIGAAIRLTVTVPGQCG